MFCNNYFFKNISSETKRRESSDTVSRLKVFLRIKYLIKKKKKRKRRIFSTPLGVVESGRHWGIAGTIVPRIAG